MKDTTLPELQTRVNLGWTLDSYSDSFKAVPLVHRDFQHALHHVMKPLGKLSAMVEEADHTQVAALKCFLATDVGKYLADLVISALRMASVNPSGAINLQSAVLARIEEKMGDKLAPQVEPPPAEIPAPSEAIQVLTDAVLTLARRINNKPECQEDVIMELGILQKQLEAKG